MGEWRPKALLRHGWRRSIAAVLLAIALSSASGCGGDGHEQGGVTIVVSSRNLPEENLLREIYAQTLEAAGFKVRRYDYEPGLPSEELEKGRISGYPDHLNTALTEATPAKLEDVPGAVDTAYEEAKRELRSKGLVPFPPASFVRTSAVGLLRKTAERQGLEALADLKGRADEMAFQGEYYCPSRADCLAGLGRGYGIEFGAFTVKEPPSRLYEALRKGEADAVMLVTTEGRLADKSGWLVVLEDEEHRLPAANGLWMTSQAVIDEAGPGYEKAILKAQRGLTLRTVRRLNAAVELEGRVPARVAAEYLKSNG